MQSDRLKRKKRAVSEKVTVVSDDESSDNAGKPKRESSPDADDEIIFVPHNPKTWSEKNIETWVNWASKKFQLTPSLDVSRFPKSAEELATYSKADFYIVCGSFEGGKMISQHYKYMMSNAQEKFDETLQTIGDPGELKFILNKY